MKSHKVLLFFCLLLIGSTCFAFADDSEDISEPVQVDLDSPAPVYVDITQLLNSKDTSEPGDSPELVEILDKQLVEVNQTRQTVQSSDANGFKAVLLTVLGDYETVVTDYTYTTNNSYTSHSIEIEQDYAWICSAAMLGIIVYCTFRIIGGMLCRQ